MKTYLVSIPRAFHVLFYLILLEPLQVRYSCYPYFIDEELKLRVSSTAWRVSWCTVDGLFTWFICHLSFLSIYLFWFMFCEFLSLVFQHIVIVQNTIRGHYISFVLCFICTPSLIYFVYRSLLYYYTVQNTLQTCSHKHII